MKESKMKNLHMIDVQLQVALATLATLLATLVGLACQHKTASAAAIGGFVLLTSIADAFTSVASGGL